MPEFCRCLILTYPISIYLSIYLSVYLGDWLWSGKGIMDSQTPRIIAGCLSVCLSIYPSIYLSNYQTIFISVYLSISVPGRLVVIREWDNGSTNTKNHGRMNLTMCPGLTVHGSLLRGLQVLGAYLNIKNYCNLNGKSKKSLKTNKRTDSM